MSFFDDGDPPTSTRTQVRPPARPRQPAPTARTPTHAPDPTTARHRQLAALGGAIVFILIFGLLVNSCMNSREVRALKDYNRDVTTLVDASQDQSKQLFDALGQAANTDQNVDVAINQIRLDAEETGRRARGLSVPGAMKPAQRNLSLVLNLRSGAIAKIADLLPTATGDKASAADAMIKISGEMRALLASDVIYSQRVSPLILDALDGAGITGQRIANSQFLQSDGWLDPNKADDRINPTAFAGSRSGQTAPGLHGHGLVSVKIGSVTLVPGTSNRVPVSARPSIDVAFQNQGENDETDVVVTANVTTGGKTTPLKKTVNLSRKGVQQNASLAFSSTPPAGQAAQIAISVAKVPGENNVANNKQTYSVLFTK